MRCQRAEQRGEDAVRTIRHLTWWSSNGGMLRHKRQVESGAHEVRVEAEVQSVRAEYERP
jgi:hypothetical protein